MKSIKNAFLVSALSLGLVVGAVGIVSAATSTNTNNAPAASVTEISTPAKTAADTNATQNSGSQNQTPQSGAQQTVPQPPVPNQSTPNGYYGNCNGYGYGYGCGRR